MRIMDRETSADSKKDSNIKQFPISQKNQFKILNSFKIIQKMSEPTFKSTLSKK